MEKVRLEKPLLVEVSAEGRVTVYGVDITHAMLANDPSRLLDMAQTAFWMLNITPEEEVEC